MMFNIPLGIAIGYAVVALFMFGVGGIFMWIFLRTESEHYKELYEKVAEEKKQLQLEYNRRLDILGKALETDTTYVSFGMTDFNFEPLEAPTSSNGFVDNMYE